MHKIFYIAVGNELLNYKTNRYIPIISRKLQEIGAELKGEITVGDDVKQLITSIDFASKNSNLIIITGGLGPTKDDITRDAISKYLNLPLIFSKKVEKILSKYGDVKNDEYLKNQCMVIKNAIIIENEFGTAQGEIIKSKGKVYILLPGPLNEWQPMWKKVTTYIKKGKKIFSSTIKIADLTESEVEKIIYPKIKDFLGSINYNILAGPNIVELNFTSESKKLLQKLEEEISKLISKNIYSTKDEKLEEVVGKILTEKRLTLSTAESCTGGLLSSKITDIPGSSKYYLGGINAYSNEMKSKILGVKKETLLNYGAVSKETAIEMAIGVKKLIKSDCSIAITGIAGPTGGTKQKPVGTVFIAVLFGKRIDVVKKEFKNRDRSYIKNASSNTALWMLYKMIK